MRERLAFTPTGSEVREIEESLSELLVEHRRRHTETFLDPNNVLNYSHGKTWKNPADGDAEDGSMEEHRAEMTLPFERVAAGDFSLISESLNHISEAFSNQLLQSMYALVSRTCERTGNVVKATTGFPEAFKNMLERIEFGVDQDGNVTMPQVHAGNATKLLKELEDQPSEFQKQIQELIDQKSREALAKEGDRKARFKRDQI